MKLKFKNIVAINAVALSVLFTSSFAIADAYQIDLRANAVRVDNDGYSNKEKIFSATGAYYFNAVNTVNVPLAEAAFLGKSSNVNANAQRFSLDDFNVGDYSASNYRVGAAFFIPENFLYVAAGVSRMTTKFQNPNREYTDNDWDASVGITPIVGLLVATSYNYDEGYDANIAAKYVTAINDSQFINVEASYYDDDTGAIALIAGDFYFDNSFSVGGSVSEQNSNNGYMVRTRKFFTEQLSAELSYYDDSDFKGLNIGVGIRF